MKFMRVYVTLSFLVILSIAALSILQASHAESFDNFIKDLCYASYPGVDKKLTSLNIYFPTGGKDFPVLIFVHGGGWCKGDKGYHTGKFARFTIEGYLCATVNYRLAPSASYKDQAQDIAKALAWISMNISKYRGNAANIFIMGHSAGAHLCALVNTDEEYLEKESLSPRSVRGVILLDGAGYDILKLREKDTKSYRRLYMPIFGDDPETLKDASPVYHIAPGKRISPFLIIHAGTRKASETQALSLAGELKKAGVHTEIYHAKDRDHETLNTRLGEEGDKATEAVLTFLSQQLKSGGND